MPYMDEPWYAQLTAEVRATNQTVVAARIGLSRSALTQVLNGSGLYGSGGAGTGPFARRVQAMFAKFECPFLSAFTNEPRWITGEQCRDFAYREPPTANPHDGRHWRACRGCERRVPAPRGWDEAAGRFIEITPLPRRQHKADADGLPPVAPGSTQEEAA